MTEPNGGIDRVERGLNGLRRLLERRVSIAALIEVAVWLALPYLCIGLVWAFLHESQVERIETRLATVLPVDANIVAFGVVTLFWPASIQLANACPTR